MIVNVLANDEWSSVRDRSGWNIKRRSLGPLLGGELLSASLFEVPPGSATFPYHYHYGDEELLIVLAGRPTLRGPDGERKLAPGDSTIFRRGPDGGHLLRNDGEEDVLIVLAGRPTLRGPDGERKLAPGDSTIFRRGPDGGHLLRNDGEEDVRLVIVSTRSDPELCVYPDSGKFSAWAGHTRSEDGSALIDTVARLSDADLDYWEGETDGVQPPG